MSDFNQDHSPLDTEIQPPESRPHRKKLSSDELIALFVAFTGIGTILFWGLGQKNSPFNFGSLANGGSALTAEASRTGANSNPGANAAVTAAGNPESSAKPIAPNSTIAQPDQPTNRSALSSPGPNAAANVSSSESPVVTPETPSDKAKNSESPQPNGTTPPNGTAPIAAGVLGTKAATTNSGASNPDASKGTIEQPVQPKTFTDVPDDFWAKPAIMALSSRGVIEGFSDGSYKPNEPVNRAQFAGILQKAFEKARVKEAISFKDLKSNYWAAPAIEEATRTGFMNGYPNQEFKPEQSIPKVEMLSAIVTGLGLKPATDPLQTLAKYNDVEEIPKWAIPKLSSAVEAGLVSPSATQLEPKKVATRADAAAYIYQALIKEGKIKP